MKLFLLVVLLFLHISFAAWKGRHGIDLTKPLSINEWKVANPDFAIVRVVKHTGVIDYTGIKNLRRAMKANITDLSGYMYPCIGTSYFANTEGIKCLSPSGQLEALKTALDINSGDFETYTKLTWPPTNSPTYAPTLVFNPTGQPSGQPSGQPTKKPTPSPTHAPTAPPTAMPTFAPTALLPGSTHFPTPSPTYLPTERPTLPPTQFPTQHPTEHPTPFPTGQPTSSPTNVLTNPILKLRRVYLMVEDESPPRYFDADQRVNQAYFMELMNRAYQYGFQLGVFTTLRYWNELMVTNSGDTINFSRDNVPLWTPRFDKRDNMEFFQPFGGWTSAYLKQYDGGSSPARRMEVTWRINKNFRYDNLTNVAINPL
jgi:hypothetical protein